MLRGLGQFQPLVSGPYLFLQTSGPWCSAVSPTKDERRAGPEDGGSEIPDLRQSPPCQLKHLAECWFPKEATPLCSLSPSVPLLRLCPPRPRPPSCRLWAACPLQQSAASALLPLLLSALLFLGIRHLAGNGGRAGRGGGPGRLQGVFLGSGPSSACRILDGCSQGRCLFSSSTFSSLSSSSGPVPLITFTDH